MEARRTIQQRRAHYSGVETIAEYRESIDVTELDAIDFLIRNQSLGHDLLVYVDPPYLQEGGRLYLSQFGLEAHKSLAKHLKGAPYQWFLTYDDEFPHL